MRDGMPEEITEEITEIAILLRIILRKDMKKLLTMMVGCLMAGMVWGDTFTYDFTNASSLSTDWSIEKDVPSGGTGDCVISSNQFNAKSGNFLLFSFLNKSKITIKITSTASYQSISNITFDAIANDNSKPDFTLNIVDDQGNVVKNIYSNKTTKTDFATGGTNKWGISNSDVTPATTGHIQLVLYASSSGKYAAIDNLVVTYTGGPSTDATLSGLTYGGTAVTGFSAETTSYDVELPAGTTAVPALAGTVNESHATTSVTNASSLPGTSTITVTAEDGTTTKTYSVTFTVASSAPKVTSATWSNISGSATVDNVNYTITGKVLNGTSLSAITPTFTGQNFTAGNWTPTGAQDFSNGAVNYVITNSTTGETTQYSVTITEAPAVSTDATLSSLKYGNTSVPGFSANTLVYNIETSASSSAPTVSATANESHATVNITQASGVPGVATIVVTAEDGTTKKTYTVNFNVAVPQSGLTIHEPEVYEAKALAGGYETPLVQNGGREYEVYYASFMESGALSLTTTPMQKSDGITTSLGDYHFKAADGWLEMETSTSKSNYTMSAQDEFSSGSSAVHKLLNNAYYKLHVKGFDQFSFYGKDNNADASKGKHFTVKIDGVEKSMTYASSATVRRFDISTGEHVIEVIGTGASNNEFYGFSLRVGMDPRTKKLSGNDTTQHVLQTRAISPITYFTKYNQGTTVEWIGNEATGITLQNVTTITTGNVGDSLQLSGKAMCPVGTYQYRIMTMKNGVNEESARGTIYVDSKIEPRTDTIQTGYQNEEINEFQYSVWALSEDQVSVNWVNGQPGGITTQFTTQSGSGGNLFVIGGQPTQTGSFPFTVSVAGGNSVEGKLTIVTLDLSGEPILYLYKGNDGYNNEIYNSLRSYSRKLVPFTAKSSVRAQSDYKKYKMVIIDEDVDATNPEILGIIKNGAGVPVLNLKGFTYNPSRLNWGYPDNGSIVNDTITIVEPTHPIFSNQSGQKVVTEGGRGLMPIEVYQQGTVCLAAAPTRDKEDYNANGPMQTIIHEVPGSLRDGQKYICFPINKSAKLTAYGKTLMNNIVAYLLSSQSSPVVLPELEITRFTVAGVAGKIDQTKNTIEVELDELPDTEKMNELHPIVTIKDSKRTWVTPDSEEGQDFSGGRAVIYTVRDYINVRNYTVTVINKTGIEEVYAEGDWVNIYDIHGRHIALTNENIYTMDLPQGMYIIVTAKGSMKIFK